MKLFKSDVREFLLSFLEENAPRTVFFLHRLWKEQENAITYKELREALLSGEINKEWFGQWQQDYSAFVAEHLEPDWRKAIREAARRQEENFSGWRFDPASEGINRWTSQRGAAFVTNSTDAQIKALRAAVHHIAGTSQNVDELARLVRPMIGLTKPQTIANANYVKKLQEKNLPPKKVADLAAKHAARQHRYRAQMIARTELAFAFNQGTLEWARQAQAEGYLGKAVKVWISARDERCCDVCRKLNDDKTEVPLDEPFPFQTRLSDPNALLAPPAHPMCRCAIDIKEIEPPPEPDFDEIDEIESEETELEPLQSEGRYDTIIEIETPTEGAPYLNLEEDEDGIEWLPKGEPISSDDYKKLSHYAADKGISLNGFKKSDVDIALMQELIDDAYKMLCLYPEVKKSEKFILELSDFMDSCDFAEVSPRFTHIITLNADAVRNKEKLILEHSKLVESGWFVKGTDYHSIIYHEFGHLVGSKYKIDCLEIAGQILKIENQDDILEYVSKNLSKYAGNIPDGCEIISEAFSSYMNGENNDFALKFLKKCGLLPSKGDEL